jgi:hypothetical protein
VIRPASKVFARVALAAIGVCVLGAGLLTLLLFTGPVPLGPATPIVEALLNRNLEHYSIDLGGAAINWSREERRLDLVVENSTLKSADGQIIAMVPKMAVGFSDAALWHGRLVPGRVELIGPSATLVRREDGVFQLGFSKPGQDTISEGSEGFFEGLVASLRGEGEEAGIRAYLNDFTIRDARLTLYDGITHSIWRSPHAVLALRRTRKGLEARLKAPIESGGGSFALTGTGLLPRNAADSTITLSLSGLDPSTLAGDSNGAFAAWSGVHVPLHGDASVHVDATGRISGGTFWLFAGAGHFVMPGLPSLAFDLAMAEIKGSYDATTNEMVLDRLIYRGNGNEGTVTGKAVLEHAPDGGVTGARLDLQARDVTLNMPSLFSEPGRIETVSLRGRIDPAAMHFGIDEAELRTGAAVLTVKGDIDDRSEGLGLSLDGTIDNFAISHFAKLWPLGPARGARDWIVANVPAGTIRAGVLKVRAKPGDLSAEVLPEDAVSLTFDYEGMTIDYLHGLTPITNGRGTAKLTGNRFELALADGKIGTLGTREGRYIVPDLSNRDVPAEIALRVQGSTKELLGVLDMQPLGYPSSYGFDPGTIGGTADAKITLTLPMRRTVRFADVKLTAAVDANGLSVPALYHDMGVEDGTVHVAITNDNLRADGTISLAGTQAKLAWTETFHAQNVPSTHLTLTAALDDKARAALDLPFTDDIQGRTPVTLMIEGHGRNISSVVADCDLSAAAAKIPDVGWSKRAGAPAHAHLVARFPQSGEIVLQDIALTGSGLDIRGHASFNADGDIAEVDLNPLKASPATDARLKVTRDQSGARVIALSGAGLDLSQNVDGFTDAIKKPEGDKAPHAAFKLSATLGRLKLANGVALANVEGRYATPGHGIADLNLKADFVDGGFVSARIESEGGKRWLRVRSADSGKLLNGLNLTNHMTGGSLILDASLPPASATKYSEAAIGPVAGSFALKNFRIKDAPALAKLLTMASFGGIRDLLAGEGIAFESLDMPFVVGDSQIALGPGKAYGPAVGLTLQGDVSRKSGELDFSGTLVPAYTLNTALGYVPVIGPLFVSREGEGLFALTYAIKGSASDPRVSVNPLAALAPGFLRRIFQIDESHSALDHTGATPPKVQE